MKGVLLLVDKAFRALLDYKSAMAQARVMLSKGLITEREYTIIETKMCGKFGINSVSLYRDNDWINSAFRGNIEPVKEVL